MRRQNNRKRHWIIATLVIATIAIMLFLFRRIEPVERTIQHARSAAVNVGVGVGNIIETIFYSKSDLINENTMLKEQLNQYAIDKAAYDELKKEHDDLLSLVDYIKYSNQDAVIAKVISRSSDFQGDQIQIDRGHIDGISVGDAVVVNNQLYVGSVTKVSEYSSEVRLITDSTSKVAVSMLSSDTIGIAEGRKGLFLQVGFIPQSTDVQENDLIVTSGLNPKIPYGLIVGSIKQVHTDEHDPFKSAFIEPLVDLRKLRIVAVLQIQDL